MKIIHFIDSAGLYGAEKMLLALCSEQIKAGLTPTIVSCGELDSREKPLEIAATELRIATISWRMKKGFNLEGTKRLLQLAELMDADIYHSHGYKFNILLGYFKSQYKQKFISTVHGYIPSPLFSKGWAYQTLDKFLLKRAERIVYVNEVDRLRYAKGDSRSATIDNGIEIRESKPTNQAHTYKMVYIGRLSHEKGVNHIPQAIKEVLAVHPNLTLDMYGLGPLLDELEKNIDRLGLNGAVKLKGYLNNAGETIENYDCVLMPSITEGLPIVALEAINNQRAILCTKVGGLPKLLGLNYPFYIQDIDQGVCISQSILKYYKYDKTKIDDLCTTLKEKLTNSYSAEKMCLEYKETYQNILTP